MIMHTLQVISVHVKMASLLVQSAVQSTRIPPWSPVEGLVFVYSAPAQASGLSSPVRPPLAAAHTAGVMIAASEFIAKWEKTLRPRSHWTRSTSQQAYAMEPTVVNKSVHRACKQHQRGLHVHKCLCKSAHSFCANGVLQLSQ